MEPLKAGDWVRDIRPGMKRPIVQLQPNCIALTNPKEDGKHFIKWVPELEEYCWRKYDGNYILFQYLDTKRATWDLQPFIGELPSGAE